MEVEPGLLSQHQGIQEQVLPIMVWLVSPQEAIRIGMLNLQIQHQHLVQLQPLLYGKRKRLT